MIVRQKRGCSLPLRLLLGLLILAGPDALAGENEPRPRFYPRVEVFCVGIDGAFSSGVTKLSLAEAEARAFAASAKKYFGYSPKLLLGKAATRRAIEEQLDEYQRTLGHK